MAVHKNEDVLERGRYETENYRFLHQDGALPQLDQIQETHEPNNLDYPSGPQHQMLDPQPGADEAGRPRSRFSGMFNKKERSPSVGPPDPPRKLKKLRGIV